MLVLYRPDVYSGLHCSPAGCSGAFPRPGTSQSGALGCSQPWSSPARQGVEDRRGAGKPGATSGLWAGGLTPSSGSTAVTWSELSVAGECAAQYLALCRSSSLQLTGKSTWQPEESCPSWATSSPRCVARPSQGPFPEPLSCSSFSINFVVNSSLQGEILVQNAGIPIFVCFFK